MKRSRKLLKKRRSQILEIVEKLGDVKVLDLAENLGVSPITIRRDLLYLEDRKLLSRYYGGVKVRQEEKLDEVDEIEICKQKIAKYAASLVEDGDTIFINTSSTALAMIEYITAKDVTVLTNNGNAINHQRSSSLTIILTGGELRHIKGTMVGDPALDSINRTTAKKSFVGCSGLSVEIGMTTEFFNEVKINEAMLTRVVGEAYILADHTKFCKKSSFTSCPIEKIKNIITDDHISGEIIRQYEEKGIKIHQAES